MSFRCNKLARLQISGAKKIRSKNSELKSVGPTLSNTNLGGKIQEQKLQAKITGLKCWGLIIGPNYKGHTFQEYIFGPKNHIFSVKSWRWNILLKYEAEHNKVYTSSVRRLMPIIQHPLYNAISQKPLQEAGGKHKILQLFASI